MEKRFKSLSLFGLQERFSDEESCIIYLSSLKWNFIYKRAFAKAGKALKIEDLIFSTIKQDS